jgi:NTP pyrophosphatase (non-canonical NTP hydrolase)
MEYYNKMVKIEHFNGLTNAQTERLAILSEECGEVVQRVAKILRFGYDSTHPVKSPHGNKEQLENELGDLANIIDMMLEAGDIDEDRMLFYQEEKAAKIGKYLKHQGE